MNTEKTTVTNEQMQDAVVLATKINEQGQLVDEHGNVIEQTPEDLEAVPFDVTNTVH